MAEAKLTEIMRFFGYASPAQFRKEWLELSDEGRAQLREGIGNGTLTY